MQWFRILLISGLAGLFAAGAVFMGWDLIGKIRLILSDSQRRRRIQSEDEALNNPSQGNEEK